MTAEAWAQTALKHALLRDDKASEWMGIEVEHLAPGEATITMELRPEMLNGFGIAHGGMVFAFADTAFALACNGAVENTETMTVASGVDVNFLRPAIAGQKLTATARQTASSGRSGLTDVVISATDPDTGESTDIAQFRGRSRTIPRPGKPRS